MYLTQKLGANGNTTCLLTYYAPTPTTHITNLETEDELLKIYMFTDLLLLETLCYICTLET
jgi:hypothetical protein